MEAIVKPLIMYCDGISKGLNWRKHRLTSFCFAPCSGFPMEGQVDQQMCPALILFEGAGTKDACTFYGSWA